MKFSFLLLFCITDVLIFCIECESFPKCCEQPFYYNADFLFLFKCGISICTVKSERTACISCVPKISQHDSIQVSKGEISKPEKLCEGQNKTVILSWQSSVRYSIYLIEGRLQDASQWGIVGMTNKSFVEISNLDLHVKYQFRVTPALSANASIRPLTSEWMQLTGSFSVPFNLSVSDFVMDDGLLKAILRWNASKDSPCSYNVVWWLTQEVGHLEQRTFQLTAGGLVVVFDDLLFQRNYTVSVTPSSNTWRAAQMQFVTPTCLTMTAGNFSICAPGPPLNISMQVKGTTAFVAWMAPEHSSSTNEVRGYTLSIMEEGTHQVQYFNFQKDTLNASFPLSNQPYLLELRATSEGGIGTPVFLRLPAYESSMSAGFLLPHHYIIPSLALLLVFLSLIFFKLQRKTRKAKPCGVADVEGHLRPLLVNVDNIQLHEVLGKGAFSVVHRATYARSKSKEEVAVKVFPSETKTRQELLHEVEMMCIVGRHRNIVGLHGFTLDLQQMYLILEYCPLGNLHTYLLYLKPKLMHLKSLSTSDQKRSVSEKCRGYGKQLCSYIYQVVQAMEYIASLKLVHRDVAARNVLMSTKERVKLADFGLSRDVYENGLYDGSAHNKLPIKWMAPESISKQKFSIASDVWSFGVLMWEVFKFGKEPYEGLSNCRLLEYLNLGFRLQKPHCTQEWYDVMQLCWMENPRERPTFQQLSKRISFIVDEIALYTPVI